MPQLHGGSGCLQGETTEASTALRGAFVFLKLPNHGERGQINESCKLKPWPSPVILLLPGRKAAQGTHPAVMSHTSVCTKVLSFQEQDTCSCCLCVFSDLASTCPNKTHCPLVLQLKDGDIMTQLEILNKEGKERMGRLHKEPHSAAQQRGAYNFIFLPCT